jgi:hypothetical protein
MRLLCAPYCGNEYAMNADVLLLEIAPDDAAMLLRAMEHGRRFLREMVEKGLVTAPHGHVAFPSSIRFRIFGTLPEPLGSIRDGIDEEEWTALADEDSSLIRQLNNEATETELECHYLMIYEDSVFISALSRHGEDRFECRALSRTMIEEIAQGKTPAKLATIEEGTHHELCSDV